MAKFVQREQSQLYLLPPDMRDWLADDDLAHFVVEAVERVPMSAFEVNERGTGSAQYHPRTMLALLVYCYANGIFGSRRIERATYRDIGIRYVGANCHPDHDTICTFRRTNFEAVSEVFVEVLLMARELKLLRVGTVSVDGTKVDANANKRNSIRYDRAEFAAARWPTEAPGRGRTPPRSPSGSVCPAPKSVSLRVATRNPGSGGCPSSSPIVLSLGGLSRGPP